MSPTTDPDTTITTGELHRAVGLIRGDIKDLKTNVDGRPTANDHKNALQRISDLEDWQKWAMRVGIPALCVAVINLGNTITERFPQ